MKVLVVEDDRFSRESLRAMIASDGYEVLCGENGTEGLEIFLRERPEMVVTDWLMPEMDGITLVQKIRAFDELRYTYVIMVTVKNRKEDMLAGMVTGVDDFLGKPFHRQELIVRMRAGERIIQLQGDLAARIKELEEANRQVQELQGLLPICAYCRKVRDDGNLWQQIDEYIVKRSDRLTLSHCICPDCYDRHVKPMEQAFYAGHEVDTQQH